VSKYLIQGNYVGEGVKGLIKEGGSSRRARIEKMVGTMGGKVDAFYYAFGEYDVYVIVDMPDNVSAAALSLAVNASGAVSLRTIVLMTPEEIDQAGKKTPNYQPPGQS
jgi:uncharacterized protein with GYD domain